MIKLEFKLVVRNAPDAMDAPQVQINSLHVGFDNLYVTKNSPERIDDIARIKISGCDLVQHRRKENEILATDQRHLYVRSTREPFVEVHCRVKPGKPTTGNDYSSRLHPITANRNTTRVINIPRVINILLMAFHHSVFFPSFSQACGAGNFTN